jgi:hypothetical protein
MTRIKALWVYLLDLAGFYVPSEVSEDLPKSLAEYRARKAALEARYHTDRRGA